jgi:hypothetical protein
MRTVPAVLLLLFFFSGCAFAGDAPDAALPVRKWYAGIGLGFGMATEPDWTVVDSYYGSQGYLATGGSGLGIMTGLNIYGGYRLREFLDLELGFPGASWNHSTTYTQLIGSGTIWSKRNVYFSALTASALLRPTPDRGFYLRLGVHSSEYGANKTVTGTVANVNAIAAGDRLPLDTPYRGWGPLLGVGVDFNTSRVGAVRLDYQYFARLAGTSASANLFTVGYHFNF